MAPDKAGRLRLLSLDGGGIRGLSTIMILKDIMRGLNRGRTPSETLRPYQVFDLIGGTSTGGILAIMLGRLRMSVEECETAYLSMSERIFNPRRCAANIVSRAHDAWKMEGRFDSNELNATIWETLDKHGFYSEELLQDSCDECKVFVCAVLTSNTTACVLRSYPNDELVELLYDSCTIWEACRATSAATSFFDPIAIGPYSQSFADGAIMYNNPIQLVYREAETLWPDRVQDAILISLGTGSAPSPTLEGNIVKVVQALKDIVVQTDSAADDFFSDHKWMADRGQLYRFNVHHGLGEIGLEEYKEKRRIADATHAYLKNGEIRQRWRKCVQELGTKEKTGALPVVAANISLPVRPRESRSPPVTPQTPDPALQQVSESACALIPEKRILTPNTSSTKVTTELHASIRDTENVLDVSAEQVENANLRLIHGVKMINLSEVYEALKIGANIHFDKNKPLALAASIGETSVVSALVENGGEVNEPNENGKTPLIIAVTYKNFSTAKYLIESGANINAIDQEKNTSLHIACENGNQPLVKLLLENGANPLLQNFITLENLHVRRRTPIHEAAANDNSDVIELLLDAGVDTEIADSLGSTPLQLACVTGSLKAAKALLNRGANIEAFDKTPLLFNACRSGNAEFVKELIDRGTNLEVTLGMTKQTALYFACFHGHEEIVKLLVNSGANLEVRSASTPESVGDQTLLHATAIGADSESSGRIAAFLLSKGVDPDAKDQYGRTAMGRAERQGNKTVFEALKKHHADLHPPEKKARKSFFRRMLS